MSISGIVENLIKDTSLGHFKEMNWAERAETIGRIALIAGPILGVGLIAGQPFAAVGFAGFVSVKMFRYISREEKPIPLFFPLLAAALVITGMKKLGITTCFGRPL